MPKKKKKEEKPFEVGPIKGEVVTILEAGEKIQVTNPKQEKTAIEFGVSLKNKRNDVETARKFFVDPLKAQVKKINKEFSKLTDPIDEAIEVTKEKLLTYKKAEEKKQLEAEEKAREAKKKADDDFKKKQAEAKEDWSIPEPEAPKEEEVTVAPVQTHVKAESGGSMNTKKRWTFEEVNFAELSDEFKIRNSVAINKAINAGAREIKGLRIFQKESIDFRT